ncbi:hypothetical protein [Desulfovibrio sp.]
MARARAGQKFFIIIVQRHMPFTQRLPHMKERPELDRPIHLAVIV